MAFRRKLALHIRARSKQTWPICESACRRPPEWPGWPHGKEFALVLTHDVEGVLGYNQVFQLAQLEKQLGFRSSFNFVPDGEYRVGRDLCEKLEHDGFEIGIHDLHHDGKLCDSRSIFHSKAQQINRYLAEWNAVGFRSAFMLHNLDWLGELAVLYDASTFDSDPFEPQPDGVGTIFPFWVPPRDTLRGYAELPYTLVQDSTLFLFLREPTTDVWKQKLHWIAEHGGMALLNVHPDYIDFGDHGKSSMAQYPASLYREFLEFVRTNYDGRYWHVLPRDIGKYVAEHRDALSLP